MNLIIDQGNTYIKCALFNNDELLEIRSFDYNSSKKMYQWISEFQIQHAIISSVVKFEIDLKSYCKGEIISLDDQTKIPIENKYETPKTLGLDRLANAVYAWSENPEKPSLIIDAGTCIKYDLINKNGAYLGGVISPGLQMRYKALHHFTDNLPKLEPKRPKTFLGNDTNSSLHHGVITSIDHEINGYIEQYNKEFGQLTIFMTGGDSIFFDKTDKKHIFAIQNLTLFGLNKILLYNV